ncbi:DUF3008 family protein [Aliiroseovarius sp. YM-037]|uniref:DUF3008 family protein n=1 Tax=Aliiroseovarius sp. YM-037 TaxID=3341728 RepID=UPI003A7FE63D
MRAESVVRQCAAGAALSAKRGDIRVGDLRGASKDMYEWLTEGELREMALVSHDGLPVQERR